MEKYFKFIQRISIVKIPVFPYLVYRFNRISVKLPARYLVNDDNLILKFYGKEKACNPSTN